MDFVKYHITQYQSVAVLSFAEYHGNQFLPPLPIWCSNWSVETLFPAPFWKKASKNLGMWLLESPGLYYAAGNFKASQSLIQTKLGHTMCSRLCIRCYYSMGNITTAPYEGQAKRAKKKRGGQHRFKVGKQFLEFCDEPEEGQAMVQPEEAETYRFATRRRNNLFSNPRAKVAQWEWEDLVFRPWDSRITQHSPYAHGPKWLGAYYQTITAGASGQRVID